jgi:CRP/FNR family transcriptional regulator, cyclic AMP receptor protein
MASVAAEGTGPGGRSRHRRAASSWPATGFLGQLSDEARRAALQLGTPRHLTPGDVLLLEGTASDCAFLLVSGLFKVTGSLGSGREALLAIRAGGDIVGELGLSDGQPRSATVRAVGVGLVRRIGEHDFHAFLNKFPDANRAANRAIADKLRSATRRRVEFTTFSAPARLARVLLELAAVHGAHTAGGIAIGVELTQPELAALVGVGEATIHRILAGLRTQRVVSTGYRRIHIVDIRHLEELAEV